MRIVTQGKAYIHFVVNISYHQVPLEPGTLGNRSPKAGDVGRETIQETVQ